MFKSLKDLEKCFIEYPEIEFILLELNYNHDDLIKYLRLNGICSLNELNIKEFKEYLFSKDLSKNQTRISCVKSPNPVVGDLAYDTESNNIMIFNGNDWVAIIN